MKKIANAVLFLTILPLSLQAQKSITTDTWTDYQEGDDEIGHFVIETTYERGVIIASSTWNNWTVSLCGGTQGYVGDNDWKGKISDAFTAPSFDLHFSKWISPSFGLGTAFIYSPFVGLYQSTCKVASFMTDEYYGTYKQQTLLRQRGHIFNPFVTTLIDIDNIILGYDPTRWYNVAMYAGGGVILGSDTIQTRCGATFNIGFQNIFKIFKNFDLMITLRGSVVSDSFDGESRLSERQTKEAIRLNVPFDLTAGLTAGIVYHFGAKVKEQEWQHAGKSKKTYTGFAEAKKEIQELKTEIKYVQAENEILVKKDSIASNTPANIWYHVQFVIDKWDILNSELVNLSHVAEFINQHPKTVFDICGYADIQTATPQHNLMLSKNRVNAVYDVLTKDFGVNPDQLVKDYKGGVDLMFYDDNHLSRCVIIKTIDGKPVNE